MEFTVPQEISIGAGCETKGIVMHELLHALGFYHEQSRYDRDDFVKILFENVQAGKNIRTIAYWSNELFFQKNKLPAFMENM